MKNLIKFKSEEEYNNSSLLYPTVSLTEDTNNVWITSNSIIRARFRKNAEGSEVEVFGKYYTGSGTVTMTHLYDLSNVESVKINGVEQEIKHQYSIESDYEIIEIELKENAVTDHIFGYCSDLISITIPPSFNKIGVYAFENCSGLTSITIPSYVTSIGSNAFNGCYFTIDNFINNSSLDAEENNYWGAIIVDEITEDGLYIKDNVVIDCRLNATSVVIPNYVTSIGDNAFDFCRNLNNVTFEENSQLTSIGNSAFNWCTSLTSIEIPSSVTSIGNSAFRGCYFDINNFINNSSLDAETNEYWGATIYDILTEDGLYIKDNVVIDCKNDVTSIVIPSSVTSIGNYIFSWSRNLTSVTFEEGSQLTSIGNYAFNSCTGLTSVEIPSSVTSIGNSAFYNCTSLTSVTFEDCSTLTYIGNNAFSNIPWLNNQTEEVIYICNILYKANTSLSGNYEVREGTTQICGSAFNSCSGLTSIVIPSSVTEIGNDAFYRCSGLTSVTIPSSVTSIGEYVFGNCSNLTSVTIPSSVTSIGSSAFSDCSSLTSVTIPSSVTSIGAGAFSDCSGLTNIEIPLSVTSIGNGAFRDCSGLTSIVIPSSVTEIGDSAFSDCSGLTSITFEGCSTLTYIGDRAFEGTPWLNNQTEDVIYICDKFLYRAKLNLSGSYEVREGTAQICGSAFNSCSRLTSIVIPSSVTEIGDYAFNFCTGLTSVEIPSSVTSIGSSAFSYCSGLTNVTFTEGSQLTSIGTWAFSDCKNLRSITIPSSVTSIGYAFNGCYFDINNFVNNSSLDAEANDYWGATIYDTLTEDGLYLKGTEVVYCNQDITSVIIPSSVTSIGYSAFNGCSKLSSVTFEENSQLTLIGDSAFSGCTNLTSIEIPSSVIEINYSAFSNCSELTSITCLARTAPIINWYTFNNVKRNGVLKVPQGSDYSSWMKTSSYYLGYYNWTIEEIQ